MNTDVEREAHEVCAVACSGERSRLEVRLKIRSITVFVNPGNPPDARRIGAAAGLRDEVMQAIQQAGYEVQTSRLATPPFPVLLPGGSLERAVELAQVLEAEAGKAGFAYLALGPALPEDPESYGWIPEMMRASQNVFFGGSMTDAHRRVSLEAVRRCAQVIHAAAPISPDGFANLRFAALANVPGGTPFFPAAYYSGEGLGFALATESADLAVQAFGAAGSLEEARQNLTRAVEEHARRLEAAALAVGEGLGAAFYGIDFSLAPFPARALSLGEAMERLGVPAVGLHGSLAAAALVTEAIERADFRRVGFSGLMLPVLEDAALAERAEQGMLSIKDLLLYSAVCGTGLDTVPLAGDVSVDALQAVLLDVAVLACRLDKPLTARLMPIPGKKAGEATGFDFAFFANSKVMALEAQPLSGFLAGSETFGMQARRAG